MSFKSWCVAKCSLPRSLSLTKERKEGRKESCLSLCKCCCRLCFGAIGKVLYIEYKI